jgi:phosphoribosylformylglycinamidine cyclo-ligase
MIHCSGGGQTKVLHFVEDIHIIKDHLFDAPPLFQLIKNESGTSDQMMYKTFNMGCMMEIYTNKASANEIINISKSFNIDAQIIGYTEEHQGKKLTIKNGDDFLYYS